MSKMKYGKRKYAYYGPIRKDTPVQKWKIKPATEKQKNYLKKLNIEFSEGISSFQASELIGKAVRESHRKSIAFFVGRQVK